MILAPYQLAAIWLSASLCLTFLALMVSATLDTMRAHDEAHALRLQAARDRHARLNRFHGTLKCGRGPSARRL